MSRAKIFAAGFLVVTCSLLVVHAQQLRMTNGELTDREKDGFTGAVRRVKIESAKISIKEGKPVEGPRAVRAITTYDIKGKRIDTVAHPVQVSTPAGREQYAYDNKGNIVEMTVRGNDGSILSREKYEYEFDEFGNWKRMISSIVTYEDGKLALEPVEITYRTLTYYYNQTIERVVQSSQTASNANIRSMPANVTAKPLTTNNTTSEVENLKQPEKEKPANAQAEGVAASVATNPPPPTTAESVPVKHVTEAVLRAAAISLPNADMPLVGQLRPIYRKVQVHLVVDEKGNVVSARGTSPETVFNDSAEAAARQAKFSPDKLSENPTRVFGVVSYEFSTEVAPPALPSNAVKTEPPKVALDSEAPPVATAAPVGAPAEKVDRYAEGVTHLNSRDYAKAEDVFKGLVYRNPEDSKGYTYLAYSFFSQQKYAEAIAAFKLALKLRPDLVEAKTYYLLGGSYHALKKYSDAIKALQQGMYVLRAAKAEAETGQTQGQPRLSQFHYNIGVSYLAMGSHFDAIKAFQQAAALEPDSPEPHYGLAMVYLSMGDRPRVEREERILRSLKSDLAKKVAEALAGRTLYIPPGCKALPCP